jgi:gliding motility-associated-like protein
MFKKIVLIFFLFLNLAGSLKAQSIGGITSGAAVFCDSLNSGFISLSGYTGNILNWQSTTNNGTTWTNLVNPTSTQSYNNLKKTTGFRALVQLGSFLPDTSSVSTIIVQVPGIAGLLTGGGVFCNGSGSGAIQLSGITGNILYWQSSFNNGLTWDKISSSASSLTYTNIAQNTSFRAIVQTLSVCPNDTSSVASFTIDPKTNAGTLLKSDSLCYGAKGDTLHLTGNVGDINDWFFSEDNGSSWKSLGFTGSSLAYSAVTKTTWYKATAKNGVCDAETTAPAIIAVYNKHPAYAGEDVTITRYDKTTLNGNGNGAPSWGPASGMSDATIFNPLVEPFNTTTYVLTVSDSHGCITKDSVTVNVIVPVPTAITPNGDGTNDFFVVDKIESYTQSSLLVFNRWGNIVYKEAPYTNRWNGKSLSGHDLPDDMYYYILDLGNGEKPVTNYILLKR